MVKNNDTLKWLWKVPGGKKLYILMLIILSSLNGGSGVLYALLLRNIVDSAASHHRDSFWRGVMLIILLVAAQLAVRAAIRWLNELSRSDLENLLKGRLFGGLLYKDYASVSAVHSGEWLNRLTNDTVVVANGYVEILPGLVGMVVKLISAMVMMIALEWRFAAVILPGGIVVGLLTYGFRKVLKKLHKDIQEKDGKLRIFMQERLESMMMIRSFAAQEQTMAEAESKMKSHKTARMKRNRFSNMSNVGFGAAMNAMYLFGACYCGYGIMIGTITYGTLTAITQLIAQMQAPFASITGYLPKYYSMTASAERLMEIESSTDEGKQQQLSLWQVLEAYENEIDSFGLDKAEFAYYSPAKSLGELTKEGMPKVLDGVSVSIKKGEYVAFTGHSGCGKSTVLKLLMSIYRLDGGERYITMKNGERTELGAGWHRLFAYVPQGNQLVSGTVRDIVTFADTSRSGDDKAIRQALTIACADEFVDQLENGIDTLLGERGTGISEGQMQRLAVARAVFSGSPVLLLDEATSSLDENTEKLMLDNLRTMTDKTVVIVTHRAAALGICDRQICFAEGGMEERVINRKEDEDI